jgi:AcrR family transcriptional regulator
MTTSDHRTRVAAEKRERMRMRLVESALLVFSEKGVDAAVIDDVIIQAEVSRGTFYNYFRTNEELMAAVLLEVGNELLQLVEDTVSQCKEPAQRMATALRMVLHTTRRYPLMGRFASRVGIEQAVQNSLAMLYLPRDLKQGMDEGRFQLSDPLIGLDLISGAMRAAIYAMVSRPKVPAHYPEEITYHLLLALGMTKAGARKLVDLPVSPVVMPADSLLGRTRHKKPAIP